MKIGNAKYGVILARTDRFVSLHVPAKLANTEALEMYLSCWLDNFKLDESIYPYGIRQLSLQNNPNLAYLSEL
ncbi:hypothetical protein V6C27_04865 [Peptococcaceae bacterium 1198_IL3148]